MVRQALRFLDYRVLEQGASLPELEKELTPDTPEDWVVRRGPWESVYFCVKCGGELSYNVKMGRHGICPLCGNTEGCTIIETVLKARRKVYTYIPKWWERLFLMKKPHWHWENKPGDLGEG